MSASGIPQQPKPYPWEVPQETMQIWNDVAKGIDRSQTGKCIWVINHHIMFFLILGNQNP